MGCKPDYTASSPYLQVVNSAWTYAVMRCMVRIIGLSRDQERQHGLSGIRGRRRPSCLSSHHSAQVYGNAWASNFPYRRISVVNDRQCHAMQLARHRSSFLDGLPRWLRHLPDERRTRRYATQITRLGRRQRKEVPPDSHEGFEACSQALQFTAGHTCYAANGGVSQ